MAMSMRMRMRGRVLAALLVKGRNSLAAVFGITLLVTALFLAGCGGPTNYTISGRIIQQDGTPVDGATISFGSQGTATTDPDGTWTKSGLTGQVTVKVAKSEFAFTPEFRVVTGPSETVNFTGWNGAWLVGIWEGSIPHNLYSPEPFPLDGAPVTLVAKRPFYFAQGDGMFHYTGYIEVAGRRFNFSVSQNSYDPENGVWWYYGEETPSIENYIGLAGSGGEDFIFMFQEPYPDFGDTLTFTFWGVQIDVRHNGNYSHLSHGNLVLTRSPIYPL